MRNALTILRSCAAVAVAFTLFAGPNALALAASSGAAGVAADGDGAALVKRGEYLARVADCAACHTAKGGQPFAGGLPLQTPIGAVYSTNITPDADTGIGRYTYADFDKALRHGVAKAGYTLYPAMPYPSYARIQPDDVKALYAYFMHGVAAVHQPRTPNGIRWPLSMRWPLALWRTAFAPDVAIATNAQAADGDTVSLERGRYLVEGLGHCGACHTSRGMLLQEKALTDHGGPAFLQGGVVEQWFANNLRDDRVDGLGDWSRDDIVAFLKAGRDAHSAAFGEMRDVVIDSTQYMSDADLGSIADYLQSLAPARQHASLVYSDAVALALHAGHPDSPGARTFLDNCAACHRSDGNGYEGVFPRLALSSTVNAQDPTSLISLVLHGASMPGTKTAPTVFTMPAFGQRLNDQQVADVVTFIRGAWGNQAPAVDADAVRRIRNSSH
ncbi:cytochrome c [Paraburkholderia heleia]|uniref:cytochrome c n=1 Tax=Paraburkholderia heleia TaxID=634127 RepID=UPI0005A9A41F|nr:cytochrome c [Paraburkholderia heleia]